MRGGSVWIVLLVALAFVGAAAASPPRARSLGDGRGWLDATLPNGLEISILADPGLELVATQVWYHTGSADEDEGSRGLAHLFEHLMFGATDRYDKDTISRFHHLHGGRNNAYTSFDETVYVSEISPPWHLEVLRLEAARMRGLVLTEDQLENEKRIVTEELRISTENDPYSRVMLAALEAALGDHPYALTPVGTKADVAAATLESCRRFYDAHYRPGNAHVVVVGPVDPAETFQTARSAFAGLEAGRPERSEIPDLMEADAPAEIVLTEDLPPVETAVQFYRMPPHDDPDADALEMLRRMIADAFDPFREDLVRSRGKALEAGCSSFLSNRRGGALGFYSAQLPYRRRTTAFRQIGRSLEAVGASLTAARLEAARRAVIEDNDAERYSAADTAAGIGWARWHRGDAEDAFRRTERLEAVTLDDVQRVWRVYVEDSEPVRLYLKPERVPLLIRMFGWLYPVVS